MLFRRFPLNAVSKYKWPFYLKKRWNQGDIVNSDTVASLSTLATLRYDDEKPGRRRQR